jgi:hypothetical protein
MASGSNALLCFEPPGGRPGEERVLEEAARVRASIEGAVGSGQSAVTFDAPLTETNRRLLANNGFRVAERMCAAYPPHVEQVVSWGPPRAQWWQSWFAADRRVRPHDAMHATPIWGLPWTG